MPENSRRQRRIGGVSSRQVGREKAWPPGLRFAAERVPPNRALAMLSVEPAAKGLAGLERRSGAGGDGDGFPGAGIAAPTRRAVAASALVEVERAAMRAQNSVRFTVSLLRAFERQCSRRFAVLSRGAAGTDRRWWDRGRIVWTIRGMCAVAGETPCTGASVLARAIRLSVGKAGFRSAVSAM